MSTATIIGGITVDIEGRPESRLIHADSNPGSISITYGGVGRNIVENLCRLGVDVKFISIVGNDLTGRTAVRELSDLGADVSGIKVLAEENTAMYISILDIVGDMELALCNMDALEKISPTIIDEVAQGSSESKIIGLDTNLTEDVLSYATERLGDKPLFLDPVSTTKAERAKRIIGKFHTIKPNRSEAEILLDMEIRDPKALEKAGHAFIEKGVKQVFISLAAGGVYFTDGNKAELIKPFGVPNSIGSSTGAGDAFSAAVIYSFIKGYDIRKAALFSLAAASLAMESKSPVNPQLRLENIEEKIK